MNKFDRYIGIDPGKMGAIAHIGNDGHVQTVNMPDNVEKLNDYLHWVKDISDCPVVCVEKVGLWRTDASDGKAFGIEKMTKNLNEITTILRIVKIPFIQVYPIQWMAYLQLREKREERADRKRRLKTVAQVRFPNVNVTLNNCDALLIMQFLAFKCQREPEFVLNKLPQSIVDTLGL
jgi:hypothetical protein